MSVINDMLRDLEHRRAPERDAITPVEVTHLIEPKSHDNRPYLLIIALLICAGLGLGVWVMQKNNEQVFTSMSPAHTKSMLDESIALDPEQPVVENTLSITEKVQNVAAEIPSDLVSNENSNPKIISSVPAKKTKTNKASLKLVEVNPASSSSINTSVSKPLAQNVLPMEKHPVLSPEALDQNNAEAALATFNRGDARIAYRQLYDFVAKHEHDSRSRAVLASYLLQDGRVAEAGDVLVAARVELDPDLRQIKARWFLASGNKPMALHTLSSRLPELATYPDYHALLASYYQQFGYPEKAAETYAMLVQYDTNAANWWAGLGLALDSSGQSSNTVMAYRRALQLPGLNRPLVDFIKNRLQVLGL